MRTVFFEMLSKFRFFNFPLKVNIEFGLLFWLTMGITILKNYDSSYYLLNQNWIHPYFLFQLKYKWIFEGFETYSRNRRYPWFCFFQIIVLSGWNSVNNNINSFSIWTHELAIKLPKLYNMLFFASGNLTKSNLCGAIKPLLLWRKK